MDRRRVAYDVQVEDLRRTRGRSDQPQEEGDGGRLPGAVRSEIAEHRAGLDLEVQVLERHGVPVPLGELLRPHCCHHVRTSWSDARSVSVPDS